MYGDLSRNARAVSADLSAIFPSDESVAAEVPRAAEIRVRAPRADGGLAAVVGVVLAVGLSGLVAGALINRPPAGARPAGLPSATSHLRGPIAAAPPAATSPPAPVAAPASKPSSPARARAARPRPANAVSAAVARCGRLARPDRAWCVHRQVMAQDRALRRAYDRAVRAGVPRATLAGYTRRWAVLRRQAANRPDRVAVTYGAMSGELSRKAAAQAHRRAGRR